MSIKSLLQIILLLLIILIISGIYYLYFYSEKLNNVNNIQSLEKFEEEKIVTEENEVLESISKSQGRFSYYLHGPGRKQNVRNHDVFPLGTGAGPHLGGAGRNDKSYRSSSDSLWK